MDQSSTITLSDFVLIVMICDVSERDIIQDKKITHII